MPEFSKILYDPADSTLFIEGILYDYESKGPINNAQIIIGKLPEVNKDTASAKIDLQFNYLIHKGGKFSTAFDLRKDYQMIFATSDSYTEEGEFMGAWVATIEAYDVYKLNELYRYNSKK